MQTLVKLFKLHFFNYINKSTWCTNEQYKVCQSIGQANEQSSQTPFRSRLPESIEDKNNKGQDLQMQLLDWLEVASI